MKTTIIAVTLLLTAAAGAPAFADEPCLRVDEIFNWNVLNDRTLIVENHRHKKFKVGLATVCPNMRFHEALGFKSFGGTRLSCLERGDVVINHNIGGPDRCLISSIEVYTPEMQKLDEEAAKANEAAAHGAPPTP